MKVFLWSADSHILAIFLEMKCIKRLEIKSIQALNMGFLFFHQHCNLAVIWIVNLSTNNKHKSHVYSKLIYCNKYLLNGTIQEVVVVSEKNNLKTFSQKNPMVMFVLWLLPSCRYIYKTNGSLIRDNSIIIHVYFSPHDEHRSLFGSVNFSIFI